MSLLVDTNVVSELIRQSPDPAVVSWATARALHTLFFSAVSEVELRYGTAVLTVGRRPEILTADIERILCVAFEDRILPFDSAAARAYADIAARRRSAGQPIAPADCQIAAIAPSRGMALATRNDRDFAHIDIEVIDPWTATWAHYNGSLRAGEDRHPACGRMLPDSAQADYVLCNRQGGPMAPLALVDVGLGYRGPWMWTQAR